MAGADFPVYICRHGGTSDQMPPLNKAIFSTLYAAQLIVAHSAGIILRTTYHPAILLPFKAFFLYNLKELFIQLNAGQIPFLPTEPTIGCMRTAHLDIYSKIVANTEAGYIAVNRITFKQFNLSHSNFPQAVGKSTNV